MLEVEPELSEMVLRGETEEALEVSDGRYFVFEGESSAQPHQWLRFPAEEVAMKVAKPACGTWFGSPGTLADAMGATGWRPQPPWLPSPEESEKLLSAENQRDLTCDHCPDFQAEDAEEYRGVQAI